MPEPIQNLLEEMKKTFHDFQVLNDQRFSEMEKRGNEIADTRTAVENANDRISELQNALEAEQRKIAAMRLAGNGQADDGEKLRNETRLFMASKTGKPVPPITDEQVESYQAYKNAFTAFIRNGGQRGELLNESIRNALSEGSDPDGGQWVPAAMSQNIITRLFETSDVRAVVGQQTITSDLLELPNDTNEGTSGGWIGEMTAPTETATPQVGMQRIPVHEQFAEPRITQRLLDDASIDVAAWLEAKTADKMTRTENTAFVTGNGVSKPRGFLDYGSASVTTNDASRSWGVLQYVPIGAAGAFPTVSGSVAHDPDALITTISKIKPQYRAGAIWSMNRATEAEVRKLKDADGRYFVGMGDLERGPYFSLFGFPIRTMEDMPAIASDSYSIAFGNFSMGYLIVDRLGLRVLRDPYTSKPFTKFYMTKRVGGDIVNFDAIKLVKFAAS